MMLSARNYWILAQLLIPRVVKCVYGLLVIPFLSQQLCIMPFKVIDLIMQLLSVLTNSLQCLSISFSPFLVVVIWHEFGEMLMLEPSNLLQAFWDLYIALAQIP